MNSIIQSILLTGAAAIAFGQVTPPPAPPLPAEAPAPVLAPLPPRPAMDMDMDFELNMKLDQVRDIDMVHVQEMVERAREKVEESKFELLGRGADIERAMSKMDMAMQVAQNHTPMPVITPAPAPFPGGKFAFQRRDREENMYRRGSEYLDRREWEKAADAFDQVIEAKGTKADGAYYWKAYALAKQAQSDKAMATLSELQKTYPSSRWLNDAKALEVEVRQTAGRPVSPENENDEDLKLLAINSLVNNDPERAIPLLQKILQSHNTPRVKERALFVLAQSRTPQAREVVVRFAKGGGNPDLQTKAVEYLGVYGGKENIQVLSEVYGSTNDPSLRRSILHGFLRAGEKDRLVNAAKSEQNPELRVEAIRLLGSMGAQAELAQMYAGDSSPEARLAIIDAMYSSGSTDKLLEIARSEKDAKLRSQAIRRLGNMRRTKTSDALVSMYGSETDRGIKQQIIRSLYEQGSAKELVDVARKESDPELKRDAVRMLSNMKSKEATDYLVELLNK